MNTENLHTLINRYEENLDYIYYSEHDELFKWKAMKVWRDEWFKPDSAFSSFADRFSAAKKEFSLFIDNSRMHPSAGVLKLWEQEPDTVERLFSDILFADSLNDAAVVQKNMDRFLDEYEKLRYKYFPRNWSFKQDRHSASVFLAMNDPDFNYVFKASEAQTMAKYIDFDLNIGAGASFSLRNYYKLCETIVAALQEHESLLTRHFACLTPEYYQDQSLHLLAFDLMYCCRTYQFYKGLTVPFARKTAKKKSGLSAFSAEELAQQEAERQEKIDALEQEIIELESSCDEYTGISLVGVEVSAKPYGIGTVVEQDINKIRVRFAEIEKSYVLDKKYLSRPRFEDDEYIVSAFTKYGQIQEKIKRLQRELVALQDV